ncbi:MBL fold metallo-hydrolase [Streptacidiphilus sp. P02-A3a]|uniref:MBL fold metallo-hydrolase n=1 Tax=Streptacidiphilus sp. P02-A3a TaxID=2704468 RepID=UPI0015FB9440|nr:MBL fold metallo-hydrolase [Streptacidiphilus sp. P02-A3a]QMU71239.1 MBL fold metallo-hydrolase [Streptacidiphilus sp. P02-A3a]
MKIHHLNCASVRMIEPTYEGLPSAHAVNHCLLIETDSDGLVLVETGLGLDDIRDPDTVLGTTWVELTQPVLTEDETAIRQVERLGFAAEDVRHIILSHLDIDHSGGLPDFPHAQVHVLRAEIDAAFAEAPSFRYRPGHWAHGPKWVRYTPGTDHVWFGFTAVPVRGLADDILLVPLGGHTAGHAGIAVRTGPGSWLLHCGDAYYYHRELQADPHSHPLLDFVQTSAEVHHDLRLGTQARLRELVRDHGDEVTVISAHDPWEFQRFQAEAGAR